MLWDVKYGITITVKPVWHWSVHLNSTAVCDTDLCDVIQNFIGSHEIPSQGQTECGLIGQWA